MGNVMSRKSIVKNDDSCKPDANDAIRIIITSIFVAVITGLGIGIVIEHIFETKLKQEVIQDYLSGKIKIDTYTNKDGKQIIKIIEELIS